MGILWIYSFIRRFSWDEEVGRCWDTTRKSIPVSQIPKDFQGKPEIGAFQAVNTRVESVHSLHGNPGISHPLIVQKFPKNAPNPWNILLGALPHLPMRNNPFGNIHSGCNTWIWGGSIPKKLEIRDGVDAGLTSQIWELLISLFFFNFYIFFLWKMSNFGISGCRRRNSSTGGANFTLPRERGKNVDITWKRDLTP